jgi:hypothetical protein
LLALLLRASLPARPHPAPHAAPPRRTTPQAGELLLNSASLVVADEAHEIKNPATQRCQAMNRLGTMRRVALTGYPLQVRRARPRGALPQPGPALLSSPYSPRSSPLAVGCLVL